MSVNNKTFTDNKTGNKFTITDSYGDIAITDAKTKISVERLMNPQFYTEEIDPKAFFNSETTLNAFANKIKGIDTSNLPEDGPINVTTPTDPNFQPNMNESAVIYGDVDPEDEKAALLAKYNFDAQPAQPQQNNDAFAKYLDDEPQQPQRPTQPRVENNTNQYQEPNRPVQMQQPIDPMVSMFKNIKRNVKFDIKLTVSDKIPRTDFIEMMEDSYEKSIIEFLADEFTNKILRDPSVIKNMIIKELENKVYPNGRPVEDEEDEEDIYGAPDKEITDRIKELTKETTIDEILEIKEEEPIAIDIIDEVEELIEEVKAKEESEEVKTKEESEEVIDTEEKEEETDDKPTISEESS